MYYKQGNKRYFKLGFGVIMFLMQPVTRKDKTKTKNIIIRLHSNRTYKRLINF